MINGKPVQRLINVGIVYNGKLLQKMAYFHKLLLADFHWVEGSSGNFEELLFLT
jgi:hypothetical protein